MGGQNNLPADTGRSDLRTWGVSERTGRGPGASGGRGAEIGMRGGKEGNGEAWKNKREGGKNKKMRMASAFAHQVMMNGFDEATVNSYFVSPSPTDTHTHTNTCNQGAKLTSKLEGLC